MGNDFWLFVSTVRFVLNDEVTTVITICCVVAAIIKGNHTNCAQFANSNRLNWLFSRLGSQASSEGTGMLDVLHCVLIDSPEALNMMRVSDSCLK